MHVIEKISSQAAMVRAHTNITSRQGQREREKKSHTGITNSLFRCHQSSRSRKWRFQEDVKGRREAQSCSQTRIYQVSLATKQMTKQQSKATHIFPFPRSHTVKGLRVTKQQGLRERRKLVKMSGWLTFPGACAKQGLLFYSHEHCTGMRFGFPHRSSQFVSSSSTFSFHKHLKCNFAIRCQSVEIKMNENWSEFWFCFVEHLLKLGSELRSKECYGGRYIQSRFSCVGVAWTQTAGVWLQRQ